MPKKAINQDKLMRDTLKERTTRARLAVRKERDALGERVAQIRLGCEGAPKIMMDRLRARFLEVGQRLEANLDPDAQLFDPRFSKHVERTAKAGCRLKQREARVEAEPSIRAGKIAYRGHLDTQKESQKAGKAKRERQRDINAKIPRGARRQEAEEEVIRELEADETTAQLVPIWKRVRSGMFKHAAASDGKLSAFEAFLEYVHDNFEEVKAEIDKINGRADKKLAKEQAAHAKKKARESGQSVPSADFRVPGSRAPGSGVRPSRRGPGSRSAAASGPPTVMSARFA